MNKRGIALIICYIVIAVLTILGAAFFMGSVSESNVASRYLDSTRAFWLAEAGVSQALVQMEANDWKPVNIPLTSLSHGQYSVEIVDASTIWSHGFVPSQISNRAERIIELSIPYYGGVLFVVGDITINGTSYSIDGNVIYAGEANPPIIPAPDNITGTVTYDPSITQLDQLKFDELRELSKAQGNYHDADNLSGPFPDSFWYAPGVPNVVFLEGPLTLKGNDSVHGFFVVGGETIYDTTIAGNVSVDGCIYAQGDFTVKGGGGALNVTGGIWVGGNATLSGGITLEYEASYMTGVQNLGMSNTRPKILWKEAHNLY